MSSSHESTWLETRAEAFPSPQLLEAEKELALVDRVIGLEMRVEQLQNSGRLDPASAMAERESVAVLKKTITWRAGRLVTLPLRVVRVAKRMMLR